LFPIQTTKTKRKGSKGASLKVERDDLVINDYNDDFDEFI